MRRIWYVILFGSRESELRFFSVTRDWFTIVNLVIVDGTNQQSVHRLFIYLFFKKKRKIIVCWGYDKYAHVLFVGLAIFELSALATDTRL